MNGHSFPGRVKSKAFKRSNKKLNSIFKKYRKENKAGKLIFISHNIAYNTKLDLIKSKTADKIVKGKHYGSKLARKMIDKYHPALHIGGHIHEGRGMQRLGKTLCLNPGAAHEGRAAIVILDGKRARVKFIK